MQRISTATKAVDLFGGGKHGFKNGDLALGVQATDLNADWFNSVQEELLRVIEAAGIAPSSANLNQLLNALRSPGVFTTQAQLDNTTKAATTAFVQQAIGNRKQAVIGLTAGAALNSGDGGCLVTLGGSGSYSVALPTPNIGGMSFEFVNYGTAVVTLTTPSGDFKGSVTSPSATSIVCQPGASLVVTCDGYTWLVNSGNGPGSLAANGYQRLPSGLIIQWSFFVGNATVGAQVPVIFPLTFPNALYALTFGAAGFTTTPCSAWFDSQTLSGFNARASTTSASNFWIAIGR